MFYSKSYWLIDLSSYVKDLAYAKLQDSVRVESLYKIHLFHYNSYFLFLFRYLVEPITGAVEKAPSCEDLRTSMEQKKTKNSKYNCDGLSQKS